MAFPLPGCKLALGLGMKLWKVSGSGFGFGVRVLGFSVLALKILGFGFQGEPKRASAPNLLGTRSSVGVTKEQRWQFYWVAVEERKLS